MSDPLSLALADLAKSGISEQDAEAAGLYVVDNAKADLAEGFQPHPALVLPYFRRDGSAVRYGLGAEFYRVRYYEPPRKVHLLTATSKPRRYDQARGSPTCAYFPRSVNWAALSDTAPLIITEGEKKAICAVSRGYTCIGIGGVFNWQVGGEFLPELAEMAWRDRPVYVVFDSDAPRNSQVMLAQTRLIRELSTKRGADVRVVHLTDSEDGTKRGLDDFIMQEGEDAFANLIVDALPMSTLDKAVLAMNRQAAILVNEERIFMKHNDKTITATFHGSGSACSTQFVDVPVVTARGTVQMKKVSVSKAFLTHPNAERYDLTALEPGGPDAVETRAGLALNTWRGFSAEEGDVKPFLRLNEYLMRHLPEELRDFALNLLTYKAQNPEKKVPIGLLFVGSAGAGKGMWCNAMISAFSPYGHTLNAKTIAGNFQGWVDQSLLCLIDDPAKWAMHKSKDEIKHIMSELYQEKNEKFEKAKIVKSFAMYMVATNQFGTFALDPDDRRMFVIQAIRPLSASAEGEEIRRSMDVWIDNANQSHGRALMHWMLERDLGGWTPPPVAPMTQAKHISQTTTMTELQTVLRQIEQADQWVIVQWIDKARVWLTEQLSGNDKIAIGWCRAAMRSLESVQVRPWYTAEELCGIFPSLVAGVKGPGRGMSPGELARELLNGGVQQLMAVEPKGFLHQGRWETFYVISPQATPELPLTQEQFETIMASFPKYRDLIQRGSA